MPPAATALAKASRRVMARGPSPGRRLSSTSAADTLTLQPMSAISSSLRGEAEANKIPSSCKTRSSYHSDWYNARHALPGPV